MVINKPTYKTVLAIWALLLALPGFLLLTQQQIFPWLDLTSSISRILFYLTTTGTAPYAVITVFVFFGLSFFCVSKPYWGRMVIAVIFSLCMSLQLNHALKSYFQEPRPNLTWLASQVDTVIDLNTFYTEKSIQRSELIYTALKQYQDSMNQNSLVTKPRLKVSPIIQHHWQHEVGYAFPSGHTIFATTLVLTASYYLLLSGASVLNIVLIMWGVSMGLSRMLLGMHWSQDVFASTCLAMILSTISIYFVEKYGHNLKIKRSR